MTNNDLDRAWNSPENNPTEHAPRLARQFLCGLHRRRQLERLWLIWTVGTLTTITGFAAWLITTTDMLVRYFRYLLPQRQRLEKLLRDYTDA